MGLVLERNVDPPTDTSEIVPGIMLTPPVGSEGYWLFRVGLTEGQAVIAFPKFNTIGIGFAEEEDWNTNLPYRVPATEILEHIWHNAGPGVDKEQALAAIMLIQEAAHELAGTTPGSEISVRPPKEN